MKSLDEDPEILVRYLSSEKRYGNEERVKNAITKVWRYLQNHPEDKVVRQAYLSFIRDIGLLNIEQIKRTLKDAEQWMQKYGSTSLFQSYITLVEKIKKTGLNIDIDIDLVKLLGYDFINSNKSRRNPQVLRNFANYLTIEKCFDEARKIYESLIEIKTDIETKSNVYFSYGEMILTQAMFAAPASTERLEKLKEAEEKFRKAFKVNPFHYVALIFLYITLKEEGKEREAEKELEKAKQIGKRYKEKKGKKFSAGEIPYKIGVFYLKFERYEDAICYFKKAINEEDENFASRWKLGYAQLKHALILNEKEFSQQFNELCNEALINLKMSLQKRPKIFQLPAREEIPKLIRECEILLGKREIG